MVMSLWPAFLTHPVCRQGGSVAEWLAGHPVCRQGGSVAEWLAGHPVCRQGGSVAEWLACSTQAQKVPGSNRSRDAVG